MRSSQTAPAEVLMPVEVTADPGACPWCGGRVPAHSGAGRPRVWCSDQCRRDAHNARKAARTGAVGMQVIRQTRTVEKQVTKVRFEYVPVPARQPAPTLPPPDPMSAAERAVAALREMRGELLRGCFDPDGYAAVVAEADGLVQTMRLMRGPSTPPANRQQRRMQNKRRN